MLSAHQRPSAAVQCGRRPKRKVPCLEVLEVEAVRHGLRVAEQIRRTRRLYLPSARRWSKLLRMPQGGHHTMRRQQMVRGAEGAASLPEGGSGA